MYAAELDDVRYTFQASGSLWQDALVMQDLQTRSLWSQISGEAIQGEMDGTALALIPSAMTTFAAFKERYPDGKLLKKPSRGPAGSPYSEYFADQSRLGVFGRQNNFKRLDGKAIVYGVREADRQAAVSRKFLVQNEFALLKQFEPPIVVTYDPGGAGVAGFVLPEDPRDLEARLSVSDGRIQLHAPGRDQRYQWDAFTGKPLDANFEPLEPVALQSAYWFAWVSFFPHTDLVK